MWALSSSQNISRFSFSFLLKFLCFLSQLENEPVTRFVHFSNEHKIRNGKTFFEFWFWKQICEKWLVISFFSFGFIWKHNEGLICGLTVSLPVLNPLNAPLTLLFLLLLIFSYLFFFFQFFFYPLLYPLLYFRHYITSVKLLLPLVFALLLLFTSSASPSCSKYVVASLILLHPFSYYMFYSVSIFSPTSSTFSASVSFFFPIQLPSICFCWSSLTCWLQLLQLLFRCNFYWATFTVC